MYKRIRGTNNEKVIPYSNRKGIGISRNFKAILEREEIYRRVMILTRYLSYTITKLHINLRHANGYMKNFIKLMTATGMRPGEIIALQWSDIDFERRTIKVERTRLRTKKVIENIDGLTKPYLATVL